MALEIWVIIGIVSIVFWSWLIYEVMNAPIMPDDYGSEYEDSYLKKKQNKNENKFRQQKIIKVTTK